MADFREQSTDAAVKLASTAAVAADQALVVAFSPTTPLPSGTNTVGNINILDVDVVASGTITTTDIVVAAPAGTGAFTTGTSTAGSYITVLAPGGDSAWSVQITGLTSGTLHFEGSLDSTNGIDGQWINVNGRQTGIVNTVLAGNATTNGMFRGNTSGLKYWRIRSTGTLTGTPAIVIRLSGGVGGVFLNASIPAGGNTLGATNVNTANVSAVTVMQNAVAITGNGTSLAVTGYGTAVLQVSGVFVASIAFEASVDAGVSWFAISATQVGQGDIFSTVTIPGTYRLTVTGMDLIRARVTWTSGTSVTINGRSTNAVNASKVVKLATGVNSIGTIQQAALTKSTQGATGVTTQDLKDAGRVNVSMTCYQAPGIITTEALFAAATFAISRDGAAATTAQQLAVTAGKRFRLQSFESSVKNTAAALTTSKLVLRYQAAGGAITITSPILAIWDLGSNNAVAGNYIGPTTLTLPDGIELVAGSTFGFTNLASAITVLHTITVNGYEY